MPTDFEEIEKISAIAKSAPETKSKSEWYAELRKFANRRRQPGQSIESAFAKFIVDPDGRDMYKAYTLAKGASVAIAKTGSDTDGDNDASNGETTHMQTLREIATAIQTKHPELRLTKSAAMAKAITTPEGARLYLLDKQARLRRVA
jgi:hypothetical protein